MNEDDMKKVFTAPIVGDDLNGLGTTSQFVFEGLTQSTGVKERAPDGLGQHDKGAKLDSGKNRLGLVLGDFASALWSVGEVGTFGANKYTDSGWKSVENAQQRYLDALLRHLLKNKMGETHDPDSGLSHSAHIAWNALALLELGG